MTACLKHKRYVFSLSFCLRDSAIALHLRHPYGILQSSLKAKPIGSAFLRSVLSFRIPESVTPSADARVTFPTAFNGTVVRFVRRRMPAAARCYILYHKGLFLSSPFFQLFSIKRLISNLLPAKPRGWCRKRYRPARRSVGKISPFLPMCCEYQTHRRVPKYKRPWAYRA